MNAFAISDLHAHHWPRFATLTPEGRNSRLQHLLNVLDQAYTYIRTHEVPDLLLGGDLFHRRHFVSWGLYADVMDRLMVLIDEVDHTVALVGNHDLETDRAHALAPFKYIGAEVDVIDRPAGVTLSDGSALFCIPYTYDERAMVEAFRTAPKGIPIFSHFAASGVLLEHDYHLDSVVALGDLQRFPFVLFGHVHRPSAQCAFCGTVIEAATLHTRRPCPVCQQVGGRVIYVGAPLHFDFGDVGPRYGLHVLGETATRVPFQAPQFLTARWPRIAPGPPSPGAFLQILNVPPDQVHAARERALSLGWLDAVAWPADLSPEVQQAVTSGLQITEGVLLDYIAAKFPDLEMPERVATVEEGVRFLQEARR